MNLTQKLDNILKASNMNRHLAGLSLVALTSFASGNETLFGSNGDGFGGLTPNVATGTEVWSLSADTLNYAFGVVGTDEAHTSSLLQELTLDKSAGSSYTIEGVVDFTGGYGDDNNRIVLLLFNQAASQTSDGGGGLYLRLNTDDNNTLAIVSGISGTVLASTNPGINPGDIWVGQTLTFTVDLTFKSDGVNDLFDVSLTLTDGNNIEYATTATDLLVSTYTGTYFGFANKLRQRGSDISNRNVPMELDYRRFSVIGTTPPTAAPFTVSILPNATTPGNYDFTWTSQAGKVYDVVTSTDLATAVAGWAVWDGREGLPATPPNNVLADVPGGGGTRRFFAVVERDAPTSP